MEVSRVVGRVASWTWVLTVALFLGRLVGVENNKEDMKLLCRLIERGGFPDSSLYTSLTLPSPWETGALRPRVDSTYEFGSALDAYDRIMTGRATGKVIVKVE